RPTCLRCWFSCVNGPCYIASKFLLTFVSLIGVNEAEQGHWLHINSELTRTVPGMVSRTILDDRQISTLPSKDSAIRTPKRAVFLTRNPSAVIASKTCVQPT